MKKRLIIITILGILLIALTPIKSNIKDEGTIVYKSLTYKITRLKKLDKNYKNGYKEGTIIEILGNKIYENISTKEETSKELIIYYTEDGNLYNPTTNCCKTSEVYKTIKTETKNAQILDISNDDKYILIKDKIVKLYNNETEEFTELNLESDYEIYTFQTTKENDLIGITYYKYKEFQNYNASGFYNIKTKEKLYDMEYSVINLIDSQTLEAIKKEENKKYILSTDKEIVFKEEIIER